MSHITQRLFILPPQHIWILLKKGPGGLGMQGRDGRGQGSRDGVAEKSVGSALSCTMLKRGRDKVKQQLWGCCLGHVSSYRNVSQGAVCLGPLFPGVFFPTQKKQMQALQLMLCYETKPNRLACLASHKGSIKLHVRMLPFISGQ